MYISIIPIGSPVVIITGASYLLTLFNSDMLLLASLFMILIIFILNQYKFSISSNIGLIIVFLILLIILIMTYFAFFQKNPINFTPINNSFFTSLGIIFWCFVGIEAISHISSEFKNKNDFFKTIIYGVLIVGFLYTLVSFSVLKFNIYGDEALNFNSLILIFDKIMPIYGKILLAIVGFLICLIAVNLYVASTTRLLYSYTKEKLSFKINLILIILSIVSTVSLKILYNIKIDTLILYANGVFVIIYFFVTLSGIKLLTKKDKFISIIATLILICIILVIGLNMIYAFSIFIILFIYFKLKSITKLGSFSLS
jgi:amino acid efflux transporter